MKRQLTNILYILTIIASVIIKLCFILSVGLLIISFFDKNFLDFGFMKVNKIFLIFPIVFLFIFDRLIESARVNIREKVEFDEEGNKRKNEYKYLSAKEKKEIDFIKLKEQESLFGTSELKKMQKVGSKTPEQDLEKLIGLGNVKDEILKMKAKMEYDRKYGKKIKDNDASFHMCFLGSPGTGKTTVARIMTGILYQYHYIKYNKCIEIDSSQLKGNTPDETLKRTKLILDKAKGGVLFIDEAYSLLTGVNSSELIAELVKHMEDNRKDFILILAGYRNEMKELINSNPGLQSRISKYLLFKDYNTSELKDIFTMVANEAGYCIESEAYENFEERILKEKKTRNFGNARTVKNIFQKVLDKHAYHIIHGELGKEKTYIITEIDVDPNIENELFN